MQTKEMTFESISMEYRRGGIAKVSQGVTKPDKEVACEEIPVPRIGIMA